MTKTFRIGDFCFLLDYPERITPPPHFMVFEAPDAEAEYAYTLYLCDALPQPEGELVAGRMDIQVFENNGLESRLIGIKGRAEPYACYRETSERSAEVHLAAERIRDLNIDPVFTSLLALERRLAARGGMVLHCAFVEHRGEAILFSAPSETGKTTQANLWAKYRGSETVNGDRALLQSVDGRWTARGWPVCGTSEVCHDRDVPVRAVVMLSQGKTDTVSPLRPMQAFSQLYSQITVNTWNKGFVQDNMERIGALTAAVPVYHLSCTISEEAVRCLESALYPQQG